MTNLPILTIAIPTFNRPNQIQRQIRILLPQLNSSISLVIYDNSSPTSVESLFSEQELSNLEIRRNNVNIGLGANIARCFEMCKTQWLWVLSDDDYINNNAVKIVLDTIYNNNDKTWINFDHTRNIELTGFKEFISDLDTPVSFGNAFWISKSIYNMDKLKDSIIYQYVNISSLFGFFIMLLKHVKEKPHSKLLRLNTNFFIYQSPDISWNYDQYIRYTSIIFIAFEGKDIKIMKNNVLKSLVCVHLNAISHLHEKSGDTKFFLKRIVMYYGFFRTLVTFPKLIIKDFVIVNLSPALLTRIKKLRIIK